jgi:hypothetical protein
MQQFEVVESKDGWHVYLSCGRVDVILPSREEAIAFAQACVGDDGASAARSEIEQGDTPLPPLIVVEDDEDDEVCDLPVPRTRSAAG